ncbi:urease subunit gamma, partial [Pseudomonas peli]|uniref:urease subunit gamma n=1 Tax=Pseudomonas peli TaxID=592361 RepID=UPI003D31B3BD
LSSSRGLGDVYKRQVKLNYPEAMAYISAALLEGARDGQTVAELMHFGTTLLSREQVMEGIPEMLPEIQLGGSLPASPPLFISSPLL